MSSFCILSFTDNKLKMATTLINSSFEIKQTVPCNLFFFAAAPSGLSLKLSNNAIICNATDEGYPPAKESISVQVNSKMYNIQAGEDLCSVLAIRNLYEKYDGRSSVDINFHCTKSNVVGNQSTAMGVDISHIICNNPLRNITATRKTNDNAQISGKPIRIQWSWKSL